MHRVAPAIEATLQIPFLHIVDVVAEAATELGARRLGVLGVVTTSVVDSVPG
jgi:aspartate racemase